ncbi:hypothetical protein V6N12_012583 [Hibiscus sabdariffa]|uniref:Uncharacterized protein n=1 Tax=Hibiscus sabdariffa TaxID=183260 RepID=A0ABR2B5Q3_9ROSI
MSSKQGLARKDPIEERVVVGQKKEMQVVKVEEDAIEAIYLGKENIKEDVMMKEVGGRHMGEAEILGSSPIMRSAVNEEALKRNVISVVDKVDSFVTSSVKGKPSWVEIVSNQMKGHESGLVSPVEDLDPSPQRSLENINFLGQQSTRSGSDRSLAKNKSSWVVSIDEKMNACFNKAAETCILVSPGVQSEEDEPSAFFPELSFAKRKKKEKRLDEHPYLVMMFTQLKWFKGGTF